MESPNPVPFPGALLVKKGSKYFIQLIFGNPVPVVGDLYGNLSGFRKIFGLDGDFPAFVDGVYGVIENI